MHQQTLQSHLPFTLPSNEETVQELQPFIKSLDKTPSTKVPITENIGNDPLTFTSTKVLEPNVKDDLSDVIMFKDDNTSVGVILIPTTFNLLQKPSSSKPQYDLDLSSAFEEIEEENLHRHSSPPPESTLKGEQYDKAQDTAVNDSKTNEQNDDDNEDELKSESSSLNTRSSVENIVDPFSLLEL